MKKNSICEYVATNSSVRVMNEQNKKRIKICMTLIVKQTYKHAK